MYMKSQLFIFSEISWSFFKIREPIKIVSKVLFIDVCIYLCVYAYMYTNLYKEIFIRLK